MQAHAVHPYLVLLHTLQCADKLLSQTVNDIEPISELESSTVKQCMAVGAETQHIPDLVRTIMGPPQRLNMGGLAVRLSTGRDHQPSLTDLTSVAVEVFYGADNFRIAPQSFVSDRVSYLCFKVRIRISTWRHGLRLGHFTRFKLEKLELTHPEALFPDGHPVISNPEEAAILVSPHRTPPLALAYLQSSDYAHRVPESLIEEKTSISWGVHGLISKEPTSISIPAAFTGVDDLLLTEDVVDVTARKDDRIDPVLRGTSDPLAGLAMHPCGVELLVALEPLSLRHTRDRTDTHRVRCIRHGRILPTDHSPGHEGQPKCERQHNAGHYPVTTRLSTAKSNRSSWPRRPNAEDT